MPNKSTYRKYGDIAECPSCTVKIKFVNRFCPFCEYEVVPEMDWCEECQDNFCEHTIEYWEIIENFPMFGSLKVIGATLKCKACGREYTSSWIEDEKPVFNCPECGLHEADVLEYL